MEKKEFIGKTFDYIAMPTWVAGKNEMIGGMTFMFRTNWKDGVWTYGDPMADTNIWMMNQNDEFQNAEHFEKALEYIDDMQDCNYKKYLMEVIKNLMGQRDKDPATISRLLGFMCEIGCWEDSKVRQPRLYNREFYKYARNCMKVYGY